MGRQSFVAVANYWLFYLQPVSGYNASPWAFRGDVTNDYSKILFTLRLLYAMVWEYGSGMNLCFEYLHYEAVESLRPCLIFNKII